MKKVIMATSLVSFLLFAFFVLVIPALADEIPMFAGVKKTPEQLKADSDERM